MAGRGRGGGAFAMASRSVCEQPLRTYIDILLVRKSSKVRGQFPSFGYVEQALLSPKKGGRPANRPPTQSTPRR